MNTKRALAIVCSTFAVSFISSTGALASSGATAKLLISSPLILMFFGFCALVVVVQCMPAALMFYGMVKGMFSATEKKVLSIDNK